MGLCKVIWSHVEKRYDHVSASNRYFILVSSNTSLVFSCLALESCFSETPIFDQILGGPPCNVRAYKVQIRPIGGQAGITWRPMRDLSLPLLFRPSQRNSLQPFETVWNHWNNFVIQWKRQKRTLNFKKTVVHCSISQKVSLCCGWISWQWDRPNTRWRRLTNPFSKSMVKWPYLSQFEHERFLWTEFKNTFSLGYNRAILCSYSL